MSRRTARCPRTIAAGCAAPALAILVAWTGVASAATLPGCASGAAPGQVVFTVGVSASGTPFVSTYVASAPTAGGNVGCSTPSPAPASSFSVNGPGVAVYPLAPVNFTLPALPSTAPNIPATVHMLQIGSYMLTVPANPAIQLYQIAPGFYVIRSLDPSQGTSIVLPLPGIPAAPNPGPIPSVIH